MTQVLNSSVCAHVEAPQQWEHYSDLVILFRPSLCFSENSEAVVYDRLLFHFIQLQQCLQFMKIHNDLWLRVSLLGKEDIGHRWAFLSAEGPACAFVQAVAVKISRLAVSEKLGIKFE